LPAVTAPGTASLHLLLAHQARPLYSLALVHPFFLASSSEAAVFLFLIERMRLSLSPHPQNSVIAQSSYVCVPFLRSCCIISLLSQTSAGNRLGLTASLSSQLCSPKQSDFGRRLSEILQNFWYWPQSKHRMVTDLWAARRAEIVRGRGMECYI